MDPPPLACAAYVLSARELPARLFTSTPDLLARTYTRSRSFRIPSFRSSTGALSRSSTSPLHPLHPGLQVPIAPTGPPSRISEPPAFIDQKKLTRVEDISD